MYVGYLKVTKSYSNVSSGCNGISKEYIQFALYFVNYSKYRYGQTCKNHIKWSYDFPMS